MHAADYIRHAFGAYTTQIRPRIYAYETDNNGTQRNDWQCASLKQGELMSSEKVVFTQSRRSFFKTSAAGAAALAMPGFALFDGAKPAFAGTAPTLNPGDVAVLKFLAAAELVETDLWGQYSELANNNLEFRAALQKIKDTMPD